MAEARKKNGMEGFWCFPNRFQKVWMKAEMATKMMAGGSIIALPPIILVLIFQRHILSGMTAGAVKG
jgi:ABC-type glycerol-3-phosphate transport system permease component